MMGSLKAKFFSFCIGLFVAILLLEISLWITGVVSQERAFPCKETFVPANSDYTILCEGASYTRGLGAPEGMDYGSQLEDLLNSNDKRKKITVINKGVAGQNTTQLLKKLQRDIDAVKPDLVILLVGGANKWNTQGYSSFIKSNKLVRSLGNLLYRIHIYKLVKVFLSDIRDKKSAIGVDGYARVEEVRHGERRIRKIIKQPKKWTKVGSNDSGYCYDIGLFYFQQRDCEEAIKWFERGIKINPKDAKNYCGIADTYRVLGKYSEAAKRLEEGIKMDPSYSKTYFDMSYLYSWQGEWEEAMGWLERGLELDDGHIYKEYPFYYRQLIYKLYKALEKDEKAGRKLTALKEEIDGSLRNLPKRPNGKKIISEWAESDLKTIIKICQAQGVKIILQTYPRNNEVNEAIRNVAKECSVPLVDNYESFSELWDKGYDLGDYFELPDGSGHCNAKGYGVMAMNVYDAIVEEKIFDFDSKSVSGDNDDYAL
ncbi:tetratricopeptide repeat protein [Candidatus Omnitrophota bacterium]